MGRPPLNMIAGTTTLSGNAPTARQLELNEENAIAAAAAAAAMASADQTSADAFAAQLTDITATVAADTKTATTADTAATAADNAYLFATNVYSGLSLTVASPGDHRRRVDIVVNSTALAIAGPGQAIPLIGDLGAATIWRSLLIN